MAGRLVLTGVLVLVLALALPAQAAETFDVDPVHSFITFEVTHLGVGRAMGMFNEFGGTVVMDKANPANSSVTITLDPNSVYTKNSNRDDHLRGPDFFNVKQYPEWKFVSTAVELSRGGKYNVTGDLTVKGVTKPVAFEIELVGEGADAKGTYRAGWYTRFSIKRSAFGIDYMPDGLGDEVLMTVALEAKRR